LGVQVQSLELQDDGDVEHAFQSTFEKYGPTPR
jgi:hypothetical protein